MPRPFGEVRPATLHITTMPLLIDPAAAALPRRHSIESYLLPRLNHQLLLLAIAELQVRSAG
jgi:hypothetical protein